jgi:hypothetical protein
MGNRGNLHNDKGHLRRAWQVKRWIVCMLEFKGRKRKVMTPGHYTELFFLDEATALAAGHRPCAECRRTRFNDFRAAWRPGGASRPSADEMDNQLHTERVGPDRTKRLSEANLDELPKGTFVQQASWGDGAYLVWGAELLVWSAGGYTGRIARPKKATVSVLTPASTVAAIRAGYVPDVHPSAR